MPDSRELHGVDRGVVVEGITGAVAVGGHAEADLGAGEHVGRLRAVGGLERAPAACHGRVVDADDGRDFVGLVPFLVVPPVTLAFGIHVAGTMLVSGRVGQCEGGECEQNVGPFWGGRAVDDQYSKDIWTRLVLMLGMGIHQLTMSQNYRQEAAA